MATTTYRADRRERRGIPAFLILSFGLAWAPFLPVLFGKDPAGALLMPIAPAVACIVVRKWVTGEGFADAGLRPSLRRHWPFLVVAVTWPILASPISVALALMSGVGSPDLTFPWGVATPPALPLLTWLLMSVGLAPVLLGEELGWRGYLQIRWFAGRPICAAVGTGLVWGLWHYPWLLTNRDPSADPLITLLYPAATVISSIFLGWLRTRTGNVWAGSIAHAANNITEYNLNRTSFTGSQNAALPAAVSVPILLAEAIVMIGVVAADTVRRRRPLREDGRRAALTGVDHE